MLVPPPTPTLASPSRVLCFLCHCLCCQRAGHSLPAVSAVLLAAVSEGVVVVIVEVTAVVIVGAALTVPFQKTAVEGKK